MNPTVKLLITIAMVVVLGMLGCVDLEGPNIGPVDYQSQVKVVNLAVSVGTATVTVDGQALGSADFGQEFPQSGPYASLPSGSRTLVVAYSTGAGPDTVRQAFPTERKGRWLIMGTGGAATNRKYLLADERYVFETPVVASGTAEVRVFNCSPDGGDITITARPAAGLATTLGSDVSYGKGAGYVSLSAGDYGVTVTAGADTLVSGVSISVATGHRYTYAVYDLKASAKGALYMDD